VSENTVCPLCGGARWLCEAEEHADLPWPHDDCPGPGVPCSVWNGGDPPDPGPDFVSYIKRDDRNE
jgi:hypothetical protein